MYKHRCALIKVSDNICTVVNIETGEIKDILLSELIDHIVVNVDITDEKQLDAYRNVANKRIIAAYTIMDNEKYIYTVNCTSLYGKWQTVPQSYKDAQRHRHKFINANIIKKDGWEYVLDENSAFPVPFTEPLAKLVKDKHFSHTYIVDVSFCLNDSYFKISNKVAPNINDIVIFGIIKGKNSYRFKNNATFEIEGDYKRVLFPVGLHECNVITTGTIKTIVKLECKTADIHHVDKLLECFNESYEHIRIHNFPLQYIHSFKKDLSGLYKQGIVENMDALVEKAVIVNNSFDNWFETMKFGEHCEFIDIKDYTLLRGIHITSRNTRIATCLDVKYLNKALVKVSVPEDWKYTVDSNIMWVSRRNHPDPYDINPFFKMQKSVIKKKKLFGEAYSNEVFPGQLINPVYDPTNFRMALNFYEKFATENQWNAAVENTILNNFYDRWHRAFEIDDVKIKLLLESNDFWPAFCYKLKDDLYFIIGQYGNTWLCPTNKRRVLHINKRKNNFVWPIIPVSENIKPPLHRSNHLGHKLDELKEVLASETLSIVEGHSNSKERLVRYEVDRSQLKTNGIFKVKIIYYKRQFGSGKTFKELPLSEAVFQFNTNTDNVDKVKKLKLY